MAGIIKITAGGVGDPSYGSFRSSDFVFATATTHKIVSGYTGYPAQLPIFSTYYVVFIQLSTEVLGAIEVEEVYSADASNFTQPVVTKIINLPGIQVDSLATANAIVANINTQIDAYYTAL